MSYQLEIVYTNSSSRIMVSGEGNRDRPAMFRTKEAALEAARVVESLIHDCHFIHVNVHKCK